MQRDFSVTKVNLGNSENKLRGLVSMERKCEELYEEIKREKGRWDEFNVEASEEKEALEGEIRGLMEERG